ncbi:hypothetical protein ACIA8G_27000 [Lentzea sp. NPDC051213]
MSETKDGLWVSADPCFKVPLDSAPAELGAIVAKSLEQRAHRRGGRVTTI